MTDYPDSLDVRPLTSWPGTPTPAFRRQRTPYRVGLRKTLQDLDRELRAIGGRGPLLEVAIDERQFRVDGRPYARATAEHPGVVLSIPRSDIGPLRFAADHLEHWQDNLRAIALTMEALRAVERHGAVRAREQYAGFKALPAGATPLPAAMTVEQAARTLAELTDPHQRIPGLAAALAAGRMIDASYRKAARTAHPDAGGDPSTWAELDQAKRVLDQHGGDRG